MDLREFLLKEWLMLSSGALLFLSSLYLGEAPRYGPAEIEPLILLASLFISLKGLESSRLPAMLSSRMEKGEYLSAKLVLLTFLISMIVTIDVAIVTIIPMLLSMKREHRVEMAVLVSFTAHIGAALTPFGTPQNLFIYKWYDVDLAEFLRVMAPFSLPALSLLLFISLAIPDSAQEGGEEEEIEVDYPGAFIFGTLFLVVVLSVIAILPWFSAIFAAIAAFVADRRSLRIDYPLLLTFLFFIGLTANVREMIEGSLSHIGHLYILSASLSQFLSNVPTTLLLERFTEHWRALVWGVNAGGFGTPVAAMANLIAYRIFRASSGRDESRLFLLYSIAGGYLLLLFFSALHFLLFDYIHCFEAL